MPDILIPNIKIPEEGYAITIFLFSDGRAQFQEKTEKAIELPEHCDLIDRAAFRAEMDNHYPFGRGTQRRHGEADAAKSTIINMLANAPVIVPSNKEAVD